MSKSKVFLKSHPGNNRATYIRAIAAIGVLTIHWGGFGLRESFGSYPVISKFLNNLIDFGGQGPTAFFVASGYVLAKSISKHRSFIFFLWSRWLRLAPAYLCFMVISEFFVNMNYLSLQTILGKALFLDIFFEDLYEINPINIGYFVVIEFWLSFLIFIAPYLIRKSENKKSAFLAIIVIIVFSFVISYSAKYLSSILGVKEFHFAILYYQLFFVLGICVYVVKNYMGFILHSITSVSLAIFITVIGCFINNYLGYFAAVVTLLFLMGEEKRTKTYKIPLLYLGNICFSVYLIHVPLGHYLEKHEYAFPSILAVILLLFLSSLSFKCIEQPFIRIGSKWR
jgi:peptidoglycan/LPS O-acetylase OafA/YrhL